MSSIAPQELWDINVHSGTELLGAIHEFSSWDPATQSYIQQGHKIVAQYVRNRHSAALLPGQVVLVNADAEGPGRAVEGPATAAAVAVGVVPWCIPAAGVPVGENFWLIKRGPCKFLSDGGNDVAAGELAITGATGFVSVHTPGTDDAAIVGRMIEAIGSSNGTLKAGIAMFNF